MDMRNFFSIIIDSCNQEKWIEKCIDSCVNQNYDNFEVILVDAVSDDNTYQIAKSFEEKYPNFKASQNEKRLPQIANISQLTNLSKPGSIVVSVDGDDWLKNYEVLDFLNKVYTEEVWVTYGTFESYPSGAKCFWATEYPFFVVNDNLFRDFNWMGTHLRTYRRELFLKIDEIDFRRPDGEWLDTTGDQAFMIPMLEMAGKHSRHIDEILYVYNDSIANDTNTNRLRQIELERYIRAKKKYTPIEKI
jgi:glycosyltransferase involved in cell wall biosynthesis